MRVPRLKSVPLPGADPGDPSGTLSQDFADSGSAPPDQMPIVAPAETTPSDDRPPDSYSSLQTVYDQVSKADPDRAAKVVNFARRLNEPEAFVDKHLDNIQKDSEKPPPSFFQGVDSEHPEVANWLMDPKNMVISHDDIHNLVAQAGLVRQVHEAHGLADSIKAGWQGSVTGLQDRGKAPNMVLPPDAPIQDSLAAQAAGLAGDLPTMIMGGMVGSLAGPIGSAAGAWAAPMMIKKELMLMHERGDIDSFSDLYDRSKQIGKEGAKGGAVGVATYLAGVGSTKLLGIGSKYAPGFFNTAAGKLTSSAVPLVSEVATMTTAGKAVEGETPTARDYLEGLILVGGMHIATGLGRSKIENYVEEKKAEAAKNFFVAIGDTVNAPEAKSRLRGYQRDFVDRLTQDGPVSAVRIPEQQFFTYFQSKGMDPEAVAKELGVEKSYTEARGETGGDVVIPLSSWTDKVDPEHYKGLADDVKFSEDGFTNREVRERRENIDQQIQAAHEQATTQGVDPVEQVKQTVFQNLKNIGMGDKEALTHAIYQSERYRTRAQRRGFGEDAKQLFDNFAPEIRQGVASVPADGAQVLEQSNDRMIKAAKEGFTTGTTLYHGTSADFTEFKTNPKGANKFGEGVYLSTDSGKASEFAVEHGANVIPVFTKEAKLFDVLNSEQLQSFKDSLDIPEVKGRAAEEEWWGLLNGVMKKYGTKSEKKAKSILVEELQKQGFVGIKHDDIVNVFDPKDVRSVHAEFKPGESSNILHQPGEADEAPRGRIRFSRDRRSIIELLQDKDKSTLAHEAWHQWFHDLIEDGSMPEASEQLKSDLNTALKWAGVDAKAEDGPDAIHRAMKKDHHETLARGGEAYLFEGKAPSEALRKVFRSFRQWLVSIYKDIRNLNVVLSPEIRGVMDRMLATDEEIGKATRDIGYQQELARNLPPEVARRIQSLQEQARNLAEETLMREQMKEMSGEHRAFMAAEREKLTTQATKDAKQMPLFKVIEELGHHDKPGKVKALAEKFLVDKLKEHDETKFITLAEIHGFPDVHDMAKQIIDAKTNDGLATEIKARVDAGMEKHADLMNTDKLRAKAVEAIHTDKTTELLALEHQALSDLIKKAEISTEVSKRKRVEAKIDADAAKAKAKEILDSKPIKEAGNPKIYITAERNAAVRVAKAINAKDFEAAAEAKRQQMLNHALAAEAMRNRNEANKATEYLSDQAKRGRDLKDMPYSFNRQVDQLLTKAGLMEARPDDMKTMKQIAQNMLQQGKDRLEITDATGLIQDKNGSWAQESLQDFVSRINENNYRGMSLPDSVIEGIAKNYKDLTIQEVRDLRDSVKMITKVGKTLDRFLEAYRTMDIRTAAAEFAKSVVENYGEPEAENLKAGSQHSTKVQEWLAKISDIPSGLNRWLDTMLTLAEKFDGRKEGPAKNNIVRPIVEAQNREMARMTKMMKEQDAIYAKHYTMEEFAKYKDEKINVDNRYYSKEEILMMALNWGNAINKDRLMKWLGLNEQQMHTIFKNLGKKDWEFAQDTWKHINDSYWADAKALEMDVNGIEPKKVEALPFDNEHGHFEGGYFPLAYDYMKSTEAFQNAQAKTALYKATSLARAMTEQGHLKERVENLTRPLRLKLDVLVSHHENMIHDLEFRRAVIDSNRFIYQTEAKSAIMNAVGVRGFKAVEDWIKAAGNYPSEPMAPGESIARWFRFKTTFYNLGYKLTSAPKIALENVVNVSSEIGMSGSARAIKEYYFGESGMHEMIIGKSEFMKQRANHLDRDIADISKKWQGTNQSNFQRFAFFVHAFLDQGMSGPLWADVYKQRLGEHANEKLAITQADESVKRTFMTGGVVDQAAVMRGTEKQKALTTAFGYTSMMWNRFSLDMYSMSRAWEQDRKLDAAAIGAKSFVYQFFMPALIAGVTRELLRNSQSSSNEDREKRIIGNMIEEITPLKFIPVTRDLFPYLVKKSLGEKGRDLQVTPLEGAAQMIMDPLGETFSSAFGHNHHLSPQYPEKVAHAVSFAVGVPKQVNDVVFNFIDWQRDHGEVTWRDALSRRTKK